MNEAAELAEEIIPALKASGDASGAAEALTRLANMRIYTGREVGDLYEEALALLEVNGPSRGHDTRADERRGLALPDGSMISRSRWRSANRAVKMAADLGLPKPVGVLGIRALVHQEQGYADVLERVRGGDRRSQVAGPQGRHRPPSLQLLHHAARHPRHPLMPARASMRGWHSPRTRACSSTSLPSACSGSRCWSTAASGTSRFDEAPEVVRLLSEADDHQDLLEMNSRLVLAHARRGEIERASSLAAELVDVAARMSVVPTSGTWSALPPWSPGPR